jgi:hypothetical protein
MDQRPAARASAARDNVAFTGIFRPGALERIRARIPAASLRAIDETPGISWLDFEHDHWLMDATIAELGERDAIECWSQSITQLIEKPLLKNFVSGALRIFGARPGKLLKMVPKGWTLAYRDFCAPRFVSVDENTCEIRFERHRTPSVRLGGLPALLARDLSRSLRPGEAEGPRRHVRDRPHERECRRSLPLELKRPGRLGLGFRTAALRRRRTAPSGLP